MICIRCFLEIKPEHGIDGRPLSGHLGITDCLLAAKAEVERLSGLLETATERLGQVVTVRIGVLCRKGQTANVYAYRSWDLEDRETWTLAFGDGLRLDLGEMREWNTLEEAEAAFAAYQQKHSSDASITPGTI